jgi:hypothetical protein
MKTTPPNNTDEHGSTHRHHEWARSAAIVKGSDTFYETVNLEAAFDSAIREYQSEMEFRQPRDTSLQQQIARKLCQAAGLDPDSSHYPVHPMHPEIYWPEWQLFREAAQEIIALVQRAGRPIA